MVVSIGMPPGTRVPKANPVGAGQAFIGLCNARGVALQLFYYRIVQIFLANVTGFTGSVGVLASDPSWKVLAPLALASAIAVLMQIPAMVVTHRSAQRVDLWTGKLIALEDSNDVDGGVRIFSSLEYEMLKRRPAFPVLGLIMLLSGCMVVWAIITTLAMYVLTQTDEVKTWIS